MSSEYGKSIKKSLQKLNNQILSWKKGKKQHGLTIDKKANLGTYLFRIIHTCSQKAVHLEKCHVSIF